MKGLEATLNKFILSLEFYDELGRKKIAIGVCRIRVMIRLWWIRLVVGPFAAFACVCWIVEAAAAAAQQVQDMVDL